MNIVLNLGCLALQQVVDGACQTVGLPVAEGSVLGVSKFLARHFTDSSQHLVKALNAANERAWKALELALAGQSFWERLKGTLAQGDQKAFAHQVKTFLESNLLLELKGRSAEVRRNCLQELQTARKAGLLQANNLSPEELANRVGHFARFVDPQQRIAEEMKLVSEVALALRQNGYRYLAWLLDQQVSRGTSLLVAAVQFFFKREVESNPELWRGLAWASWQNMAEAQQKGFGCLTAALVQNSQKVEELLAGTHRVALDILEEVRGQKNQIKQLGEAVLQLLALHRMDNRELRPQDSQSIRDREERDQVRRLLEHFRKLPPEDRAKLPAVLNGLGQLQHAAGDFPAAQTTFVEVAVAAADTRAKAEAFHNAYLAALERQNWEEALTALRQAIALDRQRFEPFQLDKYEPVKILGAGGFGVAFLCRHSIAGGSRVIKTLRVDGLGKDLAEQVIHEAKHMEGLAHDCIIRLYDCEYVDSARTRLYLAMEYFDGLTLADYVKQHGCLKPRDVVDLGRRIAEGMEAAHQHGILHRDVKPANILVKRTEAGWQVKIIDFGLALQDPSQEAVGTVALHALTSRGDDIAGTVDYAAPEQLARLPGITIGKHSDVYGFGKTCCYALFQTPRPLGRHWKTLPKGLLNWLDKCIEEHPRDRLSDFPAVLRGLSRVKIIKAKNSSPRRRKSAPASAGDNAVAATVARSAAGVVAAPDPVGPAVAAAVPPPTKAAAPASASLIVVRGQKIGVEFPLREGDNVIGTDSAIDGANIDLGDQEMQSRRLSQRHATIHLEKGTLTIEDNSGVTGTFVNRVRLQPRQKQELKSGDIVQIGTVCLKVKI